MLIIIPICGYKWAPRWTKDMPIIVKAANTVKRICGSCHQRLPIQAHEVEMDKTSYQVMGHLLADFVFDNCPASFVEELRDRLLVRYVEGKAMAEERARAAAAGIPGDPVYQEGLASGGTFRKGPAARGG